MSKPTDKAKVGAKKRKTAKGYNKPSPIPLGTVLKDLGKKTWKIGPSIGSGGFGEIYSACPGESNVKIYDDYLYVVKNEPHGNGPLFVEMHFYMRNTKQDDLNSFCKKRGIGSVGVPSLIGHGSHDLDGVKHRFIVMPRYGKDVWSAFLTNGRKLPVHTIYRLAIQMLDSLEYIHSCAYVHADLKGANILLGYGTKGESQAYLVDYGLASHCVTGDFKPDPKKMHNGTIEYTSRDAHQGVPTKRGDLEILAYNLVHWSGVSLPWEASNLLSAPIKVQQAKEEFMKSFEVFFKKQFTDNTALPILNFTKYVSTLKYNDDPDYNKCRKMFAEGLAKINKTNQGPIELLFSKRDSKTVASVISKSPPKKRRTDTKTNAKATTSISLKKDSPIKKRALKQVIDDSSDVESDENVKPLTNRTSTRNVKAENLKQMRINSKKTELEKKKSNADVPEPNIIKVNNEFKVSPSKIRKKCELNFNLDVSSDTEIIVNVRRQNKTALRKSPRSAK